MIKRDDIPAGITYNEQGNILSHRNADYWAICTYTDDGKKPTSYIDSDGCWWVKTYNEQGKLLTSKTNTGLFSEYTYNEQGKQLTYKCNDGDWSEYTYNEQGKPLTFRNSKGYWSEHIYNEQGELIEHKYGNINS